MSSLNKRVLKCVILRVYDGFSALQRHNFTETRAEYIQCLGAWVEDVGPKILIHCNIWSARIPFMCLGYTELNKECML